MRVGVGSAELDAVTHALLDVCLKGVVCVNAGSYIVDGFRRISDIRHAMIDISAFIVGAV